MPRLFGTLSYADSSLKGATTTWVAANTWMLQGNVGSNPTTQFIGTTDNQPLKFRTNNLEQMQINTNGSFKFGNINAGGILGTERIIINDNTGSLSDFSFVAAANGYPVVNLGSSGGTPTARAASSAGTPIGSFGFYAYDGAAFLPVTQLNVRTLSVASGSIPVEADWAVNGVTVSAMTSSGMNLFGTPTAPTPATADSSTSIATTAFVKAQGYSSSNQTITVTGDATGSGTTAIALTLAASGVTAGTYQAVTVDSKGRVTAGSNPTTLSGYGITDAAPLASPALTGNPTATTQATTDNSTRLATTAYANNLVNTASGVTAGTYQSVTVDLRGRVTGGSNPTTLGGYGITDAASLASPAFTGNPTAPTQLTTDNSTRLATTAYVNSLVTAKGYLTGNQTITVTGDATGSGTTSLALTLSVSGVTAGSYQLVTVDAKGRVTAGSNPTTLAGFGITDAAPLASPALTGSPTAPTQVVGDVSTKIATTEFVQAAFSSTYAPLASPALTGVPTAPTAAQGTATTQIATTAFVQANEFYSLDSVFQAGLIGAQESWYAAGQQAAAATTTLTVTAGRMYAMPFYASRQQVLDRLAFNVTTQSSSQNARIGIYSTSGGISLYPTSLVYDSGSISTQGTGVKNNTAISITLTPGLYWFVLLCSSTPGVASYAATSGVPIFGLSNTLSGSPQVGLYVAQAFGALPATFPSGATMQTSTFPAVFGRFSS